MRKLNSNKRNMSGIIKTISIRGGGIFATALAILLFGTAAEANAAIRTKCYDENEVVFYCPWAYRCNLKLDAQKKCTIPIDFWCCSETDKKDLKGDPK